MDQNITLNDEFLLNLLKRMQEQFSEFFFITFCDDIFDAKFSFVPILLATTLKSVTEDFKKMEKNTAFFENIFL